MTVARTPYKFLFCYWYVFTELSEKVSLLLRGSMPVARFLHKERR